MELHSRSGNNVLFNELFQNIVESEFLIEIVRFLDKIILVKSLLIIQMIAYAMHFFLNFLLGHSRRVHRLICILIQCSRNFTTATNLQHLLMLLVFKNILILVPSDPLHRTKLLLFSDKFTLTSCPTVVFPSLS